MQRGYTVMGDRRLYARGGKLRGRNRVSGNGAKKRQILHRRRSIRPMPLVENPEYTADVTVGTRIASKDWMGATSGGPIGIASHYRLRDSRTISGSDPLNLRETGYCTPSVAQSGLAQNFSATAQSAVEFKGVSRGRLCRTQRKRGDDGAFAATCCRRS